MGTLKLKTNKINNGAQDDATDQPAYLNNEYTPNNSLFSGASLGSTAGAVAAAGASAALEGRLYWNWSMLMGVSKKSRISTERVTITRIFLTEKSYRMNSNLSA